MSRRRREQHRELVFHRQLRTSIRRTFQALDDLQRGPYAPGPWWPEDHPNYQPCSHCNCSICAKDIV